MACLKACPDTSNHIGATPGSAALDFVEGGNGLRDEYFAATPFRARLEKSTAPKGADLTNPGYGMPEGMP